MMRKEGQKDFVAKEGQSLHIRDSPYQGLSSMKDSPYIWAACWKIRHSSLNGGLIFSAAK